MPGLVSRFLSSEDGDDGAGRSRGGRWEEAEPGDARPDISGGGLLEALAGLFGDDGDGDGDRRYEWRHGGPEADDATPPGRDTGEDDDARPGFFGTIASVFLHGLSGDDDDWRDADTRDRGARPCPDDPSMGRRTADPRDRSRYDDPDVPRWDNDFQRGSTEGRPK